MFDRNSWINSYATIAVSWSTSTLFTFGLYLQQLLNIDITQYQNFTNLTKLSQNSNDLITMLTWISATGLAVMSGWSRWSLNRAEARLKNAEAEAIERGITHEEIEQEKESCKENECFFVEFYTKQRLDEFESKLRSELEEKVKLELEKRTSGD